MSLWGVAQNDKHEQHVVPCDKDGTLLNNHTASAECWCKPRRDKDVNNMFIHNDPERGGFNS